MAATSGARAYSSDTFKASEVHITPCSPQQLRPKPPLDQLKFGVTPTDHMLEIDWTKEAGWGAPVIRPYGPLSLDPAAKVLHYGCSLFEGLKCYRGARGELRLFRPDRNMARMRRSAERSALPAFDANELMALIEKLIRMDASWVPADPSSSLYIRPNMFGTDARLGVEVPQAAKLVVMLSPTGAYYKGGYKPVKLDANPNNVRAWEGGSGQYKIAGNYGPTLSIQEESARLRGCDQNLWLYGPERQVTEVGAMNIMFLVRAPGGGMELLTPPLNSIILPGVTRESLLELAREWKEFAVTERVISMAELEQWVAEGKLLEMFGCGTAAVVSPVGAVCYEGREIAIPQMTPETSLAQRFHKELTDIQYGRKQHPWSVEIVGA